MIPTTLLERNSMWPGRDILLANNIKMRIFEDTTSECFSFGPVIEGDP
jgi:hypothetical protein